MSLYLYISLLINEAFSRRLELKNLVWAVSLFLTSVLSSNAEACFGTSYSVEYNDANQRALSACAQGEVAKRNQCHASGQGFYSTGCRVTGTARTNGGWQGNAHAMWCRCEGVRPNSSAQRITSNPYFERSVGGEFLSSSASGSQSKATTECQEQISQFRQSCTQLNGNFTITNACTTLYTRQHCPENCGTWGTGISGTVLCDRK